MYEEFCYLNRYEHPYDWRIVEFDRRNREEYMTISVRGITKYVDGGIEFQEIGTWERERTTFLKLKRIGFFKTYKMWKTFCVWKRLMRHNIMSECAKLIHLKIFYLDRNLRKPLLDIRTFCCRL
jgi:dynein heavy chain